MRNNNPLGKGIEFFISTSPIGLDSQDFQVRNTNPARKNRLTLHLLIRKALEGRCRGYVPEVPDQDNSAESHRDRHEPTLQQDGGKITPRDRVIFGEDKIL
jgi:hypothetical protein